MIGNLLDKLTTLTQTWSAAVILCATRTMMVFFSFPWVVVWLFFESFRCSWECQKARNYSYSSFCVDEFISIKFLLWAMLAARWKYQQSSDRKLSSWNRTVQSSETLRFCNSFGASGHWEQRRQGTPAPWGEGLRPRREAGVGLGLVKNLCFKLDFAG